MYIYVQSAGLINGYSWKQSSTAPAPDDSIKEWHKQLGDDDVALGLVVGRLNNCWHIEFFNLLLPGKIDNHNRAISFNVCLSGLRSETEVRALALAYLDMELRHKERSTNAKPRYTGRYCDALAQTYSSTDDGDFACDFAAVETWANAAIEKYSPRLQHNPVTSKIIGNINLSDQSEIERLRTYIKDHSLQEEEGLRMLWAQIYANTRLPVDVVLTSNSTDAFSWVEVPLVQNNVPVDIKVVQERLRGACKPIVDKGKHFFNETIDTNSILKCIGIFVLIAIPLYFLLKKDEVPAQEPVVLAPSKPENMEVNLAFNTIKNMLIPVVQPERLSLSVEANSAVVVLDSDKKKSLCRVESKDGRHTLILTHHASVKTFTIKKTEDITSHADVLIEIVKSYL